MWTLKDVFTFLLRGYARDQREGEPYVIEALEEWHDSWTPPGDGGFYTWDGERYVEPQSKTPEPKGARAFYGSAVLVREYSPVIDDFVDRIEYKGKRYTQREFDRKFG